MGKYDMSGIVSKIQKKFEAKSPKRANKIRTADELRTLGDADFITMPEWWRASTNTKGLPFGKIVMIAGDSDSGKTSACIEAIKAALTQDVGVIYVETEGKTTPEDFRSWGVNPEDVILVQASIAEEAFELMFTAWDEFKSKYPDAPLLIVYDSLGNVVSQRDTQIDLTEQNQKPGGKGQINRLGLSKLVSKKEEDNVAVLIVNYTYDNIGSPGKTNAGGKSVNFFSSLTYQTSRKRWLEKTVNKRKVRVGAEVTWKLFKNHIDKANPGPKEITFQITKEGIQYVGGSDDADE